MQQKKRGNMFGPIKSSFTRNLKSETAPSNYPKNWKEISAAFRKECKYTCKVCTVNCSAHTCLVDAHHIRPDKSNCAYTNLQCLCKYCHSKQPQHWHYKPKEKEMEMLRQLWKEQDIPDPSQKSL